MCKTTKTALATGACRRSVLTPPGVPFATEPALCRRWRSLNDFHVHGGAVQCPLVELGYRVLGVLASDELYHRIPFRPPAPVVVNL